MDTQFLIEQAIKAPSGHNTQPWLFRTYENSIEIHPDFNRTLPIVDANHRELFISLGCATENLCIAAQTKGYTYQITLSDEGVITIQFSTQTHSSTDNQPPSVELIGKRQCNKSIYNGKKIEETTMKSLISIEKEKNVQLYCWERNTPQFEQLLNLILKGNKIQMNDPSFKNELKTWMRFNKKHAESTRDGLSYATFGAPNLPQWISRLIMSACLTPGVQNKGDRKKINSSSHLVLLTIKEDTPQEWIAAGRTLERFLLHTTKVGIATAFMNQPCEIGQLSKQLQNIILREHKAEIPVLLLRIGYADSIMPYSFRKGTKEYCWQS